MLKGLRIATLVLLGCGFCSVSYAQGAIGSYDKLSSGNKRIAEALFNGQVVSDNGKEPLSLDQIAAAKRSSGWGRIFKRLKRAGLIDARNLRELTSGRYEAQVVRKSKGKSKSTKSTVVTTAAGRQIIVGKNSLARGGGRNTGRDKNRRGSANSDKHVDGLFGSATTYRGRLDNAAQSDAAANIGITSGNGVPTSNIITK